MPESFERGALTEAVYMIMLALREPRHGYSVMQYVADISNGRVKLCPGTLYGAINTLLQKEWIENIPGEDKCRRKEYMLTVVGAEILDAEARRLEELIGLYKPR